MKNADRNTMGTKASGARGTITNLSLSNIKKNGSRSVLIVISIVLTTLLLTVIASYGYGIIKSNHVNAGAMFGEDHGIYSGVGTEQLQNMEMRGEFSEIGLAASAGSVESDVKMSLMWADETVRQMANIDPMLVSGSFPEKADEIAAQPGFFKKLGYENPKLGDTVQIRTRFSLQDYFEPESFVISGLLEEDTSEGTSGSYSAFVSEAYYDGKASLEQRSYSVYFKLSDSVEMTSDSSETVIKELARACGVDERFASENSGYLMWTLDPGTETIAGCGLIALMVIVFSVLVIYNILQTGIAHRVREYGKIKALGATKKQMKKMVFREGMLLAAVGIPLGLLAGCITASLSFDWLMSQAETVSDLENYRSVSILSPLVLLAVAAVSSFTVWIALKRPMKIVSSISPVEAMRYQGADGQRGGLRKGKKTVGVRTMTMASLSNNRRRTVTTIVTMGLSCVLFVAMANFAGSMDAGYDARKFVPHGQFQLELNYSLSDSAYPENNLDQVLKDNPVDKALIAEIEALPEVTSVTSQELLAGTLHRGGEDTLVSVAVLNRADFERERQQGSTLGTVDYDQASAENAVLYSWSHFFSDTGYELNDMVSFTLNTGDESADVQMPVVGAFGNAGADWVITEDTYHNLGFSGSSPGTVWIDCNEDDTEALQEKLYDLTSGVEHVRMSSYMESLEQTEMSIQMMKLFSYGLTALIALISFMNMANTIITAIVTRKQEFGVLQAIGMTNGQLGRMLCEEGLFFTLGTVIVAIAAGLPLGYGLFYYGKSHSWIGLNEYRFPAPEIIAMIAALAILQLVLSFVLSRNVKKESVVERIRYQG